MIGELILAIFVLVLRATCEPWDQASCKSFDFKSMKAYMLDVSY